MTETVDLLLKRFPPHIVHAPVDQDQRRTFQAGESVVAAVASRECHQAVLPVEADDASAWVAALDEDFAGSRTVDLISEAQVIRATGQKTAGVRLENYRAVDARVECGTEATRGAVGEAAALMRQLSGARQ